VVGAFVDGHEVEVEVDVIDCDVSVVVYIPPLAGARGSRVEDIDVLLRVQNWDAVCQWRKRAARCEVCSLETYWLQYSTP